VRNKILRGRLLASTMMGGIALAAAAVTPAFAQDNQIDAIVVTGSRIPQPNLTSVSPVTTIGSADIKAQGITRVEDIVNSLPQAFAAQGAGISNGATGTATVNLRGLGSSRTLVLIDGRRMMPGDPNAPAADLNFIPSSLVSRVDLDTGGASAVYGSDAVAGVVNFIMQRNFEGVRLEAQYSGYQHHNTNGPTQAANRLRNYALPSNDVNDGQAKDFSAVFGVNSADNKGNITAYATYRTINKILQGNRDYSACTLNSGATFTCGGSGTSNPARVGGFDVSGSTFVPRTGTNVYNFGPSNYYQRPDDRYTLGAFAHYQVKPWMQLYTDLMFMDDHSVAQIAPGGIFAGTQKINCDNPLMSAQQQTALCGADANTAVLKSVIVARRNVEGGGRQSDLRHTSYRGVFGAKGDIGDAWTYDAYFQYGTTQFTSSTLNYFMTPRIANSLIVKSVNGVATCQSVIDGTDPACVPYNIFSSGGVTAAALKYLQVPGTDKGNTAQHVANASITGQLGKYGIQSPWASEGVGVAFGVEYRRETISYGADYLKSAGLLSGAGGASPPIAGAFDVSEVFGEIRLPLLEDKPLAKDLSLEGGYRYSDYSSVGGTHTYKVGGNWTPFDGLRLRASYNRAVRAPNILELYSPQNVVLDGSTDPCAGLTASNPLVATCAQAFNMTTAQVLAIEKNPASQYNGQTGGNPKLKAEASDTYAVGFVAEPKFIPGFSFSADYFDIKVGDYISGIGADTILSQCLATKSPTFCSLVHRDAAGSLWLSPQGYVQDTTLNTGSLHTRGIDIDSAYRFDLENVGLKGMGKLGVSFVGTYLINLKTQPLPGGAAYDCAGYFGTICGASNPEWRHKLRTTWTTPWSGLSLSLQWRYMGGVKLDATSTDPQLNAPGQIFDTDKRLKAQSYIDLSASFTLHDAYKVNIGFNNVFDKDPPVFGSANCSSGQCNGNTYPQVYDALGRYGFVRLTREF
jgi:iron complex outermembrane recepter protein